MAATFPKLHGTGLIHFSVCVRLGSGRKLPELRKRAEDRPDAENRRDIVAARLSTDEYMICSFHGTKNIFFHTEVAKKQFFGDEAPKPKGNLRAAEKMLGVALETVAGRKAKTAVIGTMRVKINDLPKQGIIRAISQTDENPGGPVSMRLVGGRVAIKGTPFERLEWSLREDEKVEIRLFSRRVLEIHENYLAENLEIIQSGFKVLVFDHENKNVRK